MARTATVARNPVKKSRVKQAEAVGWWIEQRKAELQHASLDEVLAELGRVVGRYTVTTAFAFDGRPNWQGRGWSDEGRAPCYAISYEMRRPGRPLFCCGGVSDKIFGSLHDAAVWALLGALAWAGVPSEAMAS